MVDVARRELHVLIPDWSGQALVATADGALPTLTVELLDDDTRVSAGLRAIRDTWGAVGSLLEAHDDLGQGDGPVAVPTLVVVEAPDVGWHVPERHRWRQLGDPDPRTAPGLRARLHELLAERRGVAVVPALRPRWALPGWFVRADSWIRVCLLEAGRSPIGPVEQIRHWGISALMRTETEDGRVWFKAVFPSFAAEPAVTASLDSEFPGAVPPVLAIDESEGWLLLEDIGSAVVAAHREADGLAVRRLVELQRAFVGRTADLTVRGCPTRSFATLPAELAAVFADPVARAWIAVTPDRADEVLTWVCGAVEDVAGLGFPDTLVHGDFHPHNVSLVEGEPVIFDWSDAAVGHPLVDAVTWCSWWRDDDERNERAWREFLAAWADVCPSDRIEALRTTLSGLAAGYHTVSYAHIVAGLEPLRRPEMVKGLQTYFGRLDAVVPRSTSDAPASLVSE